jgi:DNA adenine methylase
VVIESRPAVDVLTQHDSPASLHYVDPPYVHSTRDEGIQRDYQFEMDDSAHRDLAGVLRSLCGMVVLSGYPSRLYDVDLYPDWHRVECPSLADSLRSRTEVIWINDAAWRNQEGLF